MPGGSFEFVMVSSPATNSWSMAKRRRGKLKWQPPWLTNETYGSQFAWFRIDSCTSFLLVNLFTELREGLGISWGAIRGNKMRSLLTTLGIVIGIVTVTLMGTAITGLNSAFIKSISFIGADVLFVHRFNWFNESEEDWLKNQKRREVTLSQAMALERQLTLAKAIAPKADTEQQV